MSSVAGNQRVIVDRIDDRKVLAARLSSQVVDVGASSSIIMKLLFGWEIIPLCRICLSCLRSGFICRHCSCLVEGNFPSFFSTVDRILDNRQKYALNHPFICILIIRSLKLARILHVIMMSCLH